MGPWRRRGHLVEAPGASTALLVQTAPVPQTEPIKHAVLGGGKTGRKTRVGFSLVQSESIDLWVFPFWQPMSHPMSVFFLVLVLPAFWFSHLAQET